MLGRLDNHTVSINVGVSEARVWRKNEKTCSQPQFHVVPSLSFFRPCSRPTPFALSFAGYAQKEKDRAGNRLVANRTLSECVPTGIFVRETLYCGGQILETSDAQHPADAAHAIQETWSEVALRAEARLSAVPERDLRSEPIATERCPSSRNAPSRKVQSQDGAR